MATFIDNAQSLADKPLSNLSEIPEQLPPPPEHIYAELRSLPEAPIVTVVHKEPKQVTLEPVVQIMAEGKPITTPRNLTDAHKIKRDKEISEHYHKYATLKPIDSMRAADLLPEKLTITKHAPKLVKKSQVQLQKKSPENLLDLFMATTSKPKRNSKR